MLIWGVAFWALWAVSSPGIGGEQDVDGRDGLPDAGGVMAAASGGSGDLELEEGWSVRLYSWPERVRLPQEGGSPDDWFNWQVPPAADDAGPDGEGGGELLDYLRNNHRMMSALLQGDANLLPEGTLLLLDAAHRTLAARTTGRGHRTLETILIELHADTPRLIGLQMETIEADAALILPMAERSMVLKDHEALRAELEEQVRQGHGRLIESIGMQLRPGTPARVRDRTAHQLEADLSGPEWRHWITVHQHLQSELMGLDEPVGEGDHQAMVWEAQQTMGLPAGEVRLASVHRGLVPERLRASFVEADVSRLEAERHERAGRWIRDHGDSLVPVPEAEAGDDGGGSAKVTDDEVEPMEILVLRVNLEVDRLPIEWTNDDPFSPSPFDLALEEEEVEEREGGDLASRFLLSQGVILPEGSTIHLIESRDNRDQRTGVLIIRSTPDGVFLSEAMLSFGCWSIQPSRGWTLRCMIVEADADLVRQVGREALSSTDHGAGWGTLAGEVDAGRGRWVETIFVRVEPTHTQRFRTGGGWLLEFALKPDRGISEVDLELKLCHRPSGAGGVENGRQEVAVQTVLQPGVKRWVASLSVLDQGGKPDDTRLLAVFVEVANTEVGE